MELSYFVLKILCQQSPHEIKQEVVSCQALIVDLKINMIHAKQKHQATSNQCWLIVEKTPDYQTYEPIIDFLKPGQEPTHLVETI